MPNTYYAWAPITVADKTGKKKFVTLPVGDEVTPGQVGDDWDNLVAAGAVRTRQYPKTKTFESPNTAILREARAAMEAAQAPYIHNRDEGVSVSEPDDDEE